VSRAAPAPDPPRAGRRRGRERHPLATAFRSLGSRNFRLFFAGQGISLVGTWMQQVAMGWLIWRLTASPLALGAVGFATQLPTLVLSPLGGVLADRHPRHRIVLVAQLGGMLQAAVLAALVLTGAVQVWHLLALALALGVVTGFDVPARQALFVELVGKGALANAIALNATLFNAARLVGPAIAGFLVAAVGEGPVFALNAVTYVAVIASLLALRLPARRREPAQGDVLANLRAGLRYALGFAPIRAALAVLAFVSLVGMPYSVLMPVFAGEVLGGGARALGLLMASAGTGALAGALYLASRTSVVGLGRVIVLAAAAFGAGLLAFSLSRSLPLSCALLLVVGFGVMVFTASINTVLQTVVEEDKRGRVISLYVMAFMGMGTFGTLAAGALASRVGAPATVAAGGAAVLLAAAWFARRLPVLRREIRPVYVRLGIIPEVAAGLQTASELRPRG
jgi:MFS family permease